MLLEKDNSYSISYDSQGMKNAKSVIVAMHGFCGDKDSSCIKALQDEIRQYDKVGLIKFDWPGHGESEVSGDYLTIENCMNDLCAIIKFIQKESPKAKINAFATSFGGYLTLLFMSKNKSIFNKIILRSPAINMYNVLSKNILNKNEMQEIEKNGFIEYGFERDLKITANFVKELEQNNLSKIYKDQIISNTLIIHGTEDDLVPFLDSASFAKAHGCSIFPVLGADHRYKKPGEIKKVIDETISFFGY